MGGIWSKNKRLDQRLQTGAQSLEPAPVAKRNMIKFCVLEKKLPRLQSGEVDLSARCMVGRAFPPGPWSVGQGVQVSPGVDGSGQGLCSQLHH